MIKSFNDSMARQPDRRRARNEDTYIFSSGYENRKRFQTYPNDVMSPEEQARADVRQDYSRRSREGKFDVDPSSGQTIVIGPESTARQGPYIDPHNDATFVMSPEEQARAGARIYRKPESPKTALLKTQGIEVEEFSSLDDFLANGDVSGQKGKIKRDSSQ